MTKKEHEEILQEISANTFAHTYKSQDQNKPHDEEIEVVAWEDVVEILRKYVQTNERGGI